MVEYVCHAITRHVREFAQYEESAKNYTWRPLPLRDRSAFPIGVMGLGVLGERVARTVSAFDYPVFGWSRTKNQCPELIASRGINSLINF